MPEKIDGLPLHPLLVHLPIVFGPVTGLLVLALLVPRWRSKLIRPVAVLAVLTAISAILAAESGEWLKEQLHFNDQGIKDHQEAAELFRNLEILLAVLLVATAVLWARLKGAVQTAVVVVLAVLGLATIGTVVRAGHLGAKHVWGGTFSSSSSDDH